MAETTNPSDTGGRLIAAKHDYRHIAGDKLGSV